MDRGEVALLGTSRENVGVTVIGTTFSQKKSKSSGGKNGKTKNLYLARMVSPLHICTHTHTHHSETEKVKLDEERESAPRKERGSEWRTRPLMIEGILFD